MKELCRVVYRLRLQIGTAGRKVCHVDQATCDPDRDRRRWPDRARTGGDRPGRLAVVFVDRLCRRLLDDHHHPRRRLPRRSRSLGRCILSFGRTGTPLRRAAGGLATTGSCPAFPGTGLANPIRASRLRHVARPVAPSSRRHGCPSRPADRLHRALELGRRASLPLPGALRRERSGVRQGHRLLSLLAAGLCRAQELAAAARGLQRGNRRCRILGARRHRARQAAATAVAQRPHPCLGAARPLLRGEGLVLRPRSLPAALQRQRRRRRRRLHRSPCQAAGAVVARRTGHCLRRRLLGQCALADLAHPRRRAGAAVRQLVRALPAHPLTLPAPLREAERAASWRRPISRATSRRRGRPTTCSRSR